MAIDFLEVLRMELRDFGIVATLDGQIVQVIFYPEPNPADPYLDERSHDGPSANLLLEDLQAKLLWPLPVDLINIEGVDYRIVRKPSVSGAVTLYLREA